MSHSVNSLPDRRADDTEGQHGFTLIELLVVVLIIGILAAIAIPVFLGVQDNAKKSAVTSDLTNAKTAIIAYFTDNPKAEAPSLDASTLGKWGYTPSPDVRLSYKPTAVATGPDANFCIAGEHDDVRSASGEAIAVKWVTAASGVTDTAC